jgi:hypothetical protein
MTTEETIKARISARILKEGGGDLGSVRTHVMGSREVTLRPSPILLVVYHDGTVGPAERQNPASSDRFDLVFPELGRDLDVDETRRLIERTDSVILEVEQLQSAGPRSDLALVIYSKTLRVELRQGPDFDPPAKG